MNASAEHHAKQLCGTSREQKWHGYGERPATVRSQCVRRQYRQTGISSNAVLLDNDPCRLIRADREVICDWYDLNGFTL